MELKKALILIVSYIIIYAIVLTIEITTRPTPTRGKITATLYNLEQEMWSPGRIQYLVESPNSATYVGSINAEVSPNSEIKIDLPFMYAKYKGELREYKVLLMVDGDPFYETVVMR
jgi:hypothetical protein